jgi:hypothetical protein
MPASVFTPSASSGGAKLVCVAQFTVAAAMSPSLPPAVIV